MHTSVVVLCVVIGAVVVLCAVILISGVVDLAKFGERRELILQILSNGEELFGLEIVERSKGKLSRGSIYVWLGRLEDEGTIVSRYVPHYLEEKAVVIDGNSRVLPDTCDPNYPRRRLYRLKRAAA